MLARSMDVYLNGYTNSPRMPKSFYTTHSGYSKAYRAKIGGPEKSSFYVTIEHNQAIDNPMTNTEREDSHFGTGYYPNIISPTNLGGT